jgi:hypothetical protein
MSLKSIDEIEDECLQTYCAMMKTDEPGIEASAWDRRHESIKRHVINDFEETSKALDIIVDEEAKKRLAKVSEQLILHCKKNYTILHERFRNILLPQNTSDFVTYVSCYNTNISSAIYMNIACTDPATRYFHVKLHDDSL